MSDQLVEVGDVMNALRGEINKRYVWGNPQMQRMPVPSNLRSNVPSDIEELDGVNDDRLIGSDCSGLIFRGIAKAGYSFDTRPTATWLYNNSQRMSVEDAINTPGALLFLLDGNTPKHVEIKSEGDEGEVFAARSGAGVSIAKWSTIEKWGVNKGWTAAAGWFPGIKPTGEIKIENNFWWYLLAGASGVIIIGGAFYLIKKAKDRKYESASIRTIRSSRWR